MKTNASGILSSTADKARIPFVDYSQMALPPGKRQPPQWRATDADQGTRVEFALLDIYSVVVVNFCQ